MAFTFKKGTFAEKPVLSAGEIYVDLENRALFTGTGNTDLCFSNSVVTVSENYEVTGGNKTILANAAGGEIAINLPSAAGLQGRKFRVRKIDSSDNYVVITAQGGEFIDGNNTMNINQQYSWVEVVSDGISWVMFS